MAALASDWLRHFWLLIRKRWTDFNETWQEAISQRLVSSLCFSGRLEKQDDPPWPLIGWDFSTYSLKPLNRIQRKLDRKQDPNVLYQVCVFGLIGKTRWPPWPLICSDIFDFSSKNRWTEFNETWQEARSQRPLPSVCFFGPIGKTCWPPRPLIGWDIFDFSSETAERNSTKLDRKLDLNVLYQVRVFLADRKNKMAALVSDWLRHFLFLLWIRLMELNET